MSDSALATAVSGGEGQTPFTAADVAMAVGGELDGDGAVELRGVAPLDRAGPNDLSFLAHERYASWYGKTRAGVVLVARELSGTPGNPRARVLVDKPTEAMLQLLSRFHRPETRAQGVHPSAVVAPDAVIGVGVTIEPLAVIGAGVTLGDGCWIGAGSSIGAQSRLGADVRVHASVSVYPRVEIGDRVVLHAGASVGRDGFGFVPRDGRVSRIPHPGRCVLEHDVEIGANSCVDRGSVDDTVIGAGTKIDSLVHVAHNVRIGRMCFIAAQTGIAGSVRIGDGVQLGGQAGINGHITIADKATIAGQAGVFGDVPAGETWSGYPARPHREQLRATAALHRLVKLIRPLEQLLDSRSKS